MNSPHQHYFECQTDTHFKFYSIDLEAVTVSNFTFWIVRTLRGRIGEAGKEIVFGYISQDKALKKIQKLRKTRIKHQYQELESSLFF